MMHRSKIASDISVILTSLESATVKYSPPLSGRGCGFGITFIYTFIKGQGNDARFTTNIDLKRDPKLFHKNGMLNLFNY
jgi:hypothetical protein